MKGEVNDKLCIQKYLTSPGIWFIIVTIAVPSSSILTASSLLLMATRNTSGASATLSASSRTANIDKHKEPFELPNRSSLCSPSVTMKSPSSKEVEQLYVCIILVSLSLPDAFNILMLKDISTLRSKIIVSLNSAHTITLSSSITDGELSEMLT